MNKAREWWELEPISFAVSRIYCMDGETPPSDSEAPSPPPLVDLSKPPETLEQALAQINALKETQGRAPEWATKRIDQITANWRQEERKHAATTAKVATLESQIAELQKSGKVVEKLPAELIEAQVQERAAALASETAYNEACGKVISSGQTAHSDFPAAMAKLHSISPTFQQTPQGTLPVMPRSFVEAALECDNPHEVLYELSKPSNNDEAARIMALPPAKQGAALAKFASKLAPPAAPSGAAPPPRTTVTGGAVSGAPHTVYDGNLTTDQWMALREKEVAERRQSRRRA